MNDQLSSEFEAWEVQLAIKQMTPLKALGLDSMSPLFYLHYWNLVDDDINQSVLNFLNTTSMPEHLNHTFITLIHPPPPQKKP